MPCAYVTRIFFSAFPTKVYTHFSSFAYTLHFLAISFFLVYFIIFGLKRITDALIWQRPPASVLLHLSGRLRNVVHNALTSVKSRIIAE